MGLIDHRRVDAVRSCCTKSGFIPWHSFLKDLWTTYLMKICDLDDDTLLVIFSFLPVKAILAMRQVCRPQNL